MSTAQILLLGAIAGSTIFIGLPVGRVQNCSLALKATLSAAATGILLFLFFDVLEHGVEPRGGLAQRRGPQRRLVGRLRRARRAARRRLRRRLPRPRPLRPLDGEAAREEPARPRRGLGCRVRALLGGRHVERELAGCPDRDRDRPPQLRRGPRNRPVGGARGDEPRPRPDHRLRAPQRHRGLRHRRAARRRHAAADVGASCSPWASSAVPRRSSAPSSARRGRARRSPSASWPSPPARSCTS